MQFVFIFIVLVINDIEVIQNLHNLRLVDILLQIVWSSRTWYTFY